MFPPILSFYLFIFPYCVHLFCVSPWLDCLFRSFLCHCLLQSLIVQLVTFFPPCTFPSFLIMEYPCLTLPACVLTPFLWTWIAILGFAQIKHMPLSTVCTLHQVTLWTWYEKDSGLQSISDYRRGIQNLYYAKIKARNVSNTEERSSPLGKKKNMTENIQWVG